MFSETETSARHGRKRAPRLHFSETKGDQLTMMNRYFRSGIFSLLVIGGYFLWRNRFQVQRFLESNGIRTPLADRNVGEVIKSGVAKVTGRINKFRKEEREVA